MRSYGAISAKTCSLYTASSPPSSSIKSKTRRIERLRSFTVTLLLKIAVPESSELQHGTALQEVLVLLCQRKQWRRRVQHRGSPSRAATTSATTSPSSAPSRAGSQSGGTPGSGGHAPQPDGPVLHDHLLRLRRKGQRWPRTYQKLWRHRLLQVSLVEHILGLGLLP